MTRASATVFVPGSIGNVGPGFDVLGLAVAGAGDRVTVEVLEDAGVEVEVSGAPAGSISTDPDRNSASVAAMHFLRSKGHRGGARIAVEKGITVSAGLGGSAASAVGGAVAAGIAWGGAAGRGDLLEASLAGEAAVAGRHLDNVAASLCGGLTLSLSVSPPVVVEIPIARQWALALVTPRVEIQTRYARSILPAGYDRETAVRQIAATGGVICAFQSGDGELLARSMVDLFAEPYRAALIPHFSDVRGAALEAGAFGCTISGAGPTMFAVCEDERLARRVADAMKTAFKEVGATDLVTWIAMEGAKAL